MRPEPPPRRKKRRWTRKLRNWIVGLLGPWIVRAWIGTLRVRYAGEPYREGRIAVPTGGGVIYCFWHQAILSLAWAYRESAIRVLISEHGDGEMIARIIEGLGMKAVRGSSTRGGARASRELIRETLRGFSLAITPDGPQGPSHVFQEGAIFLASRTGLPLCPIVAVSRWSISLPTWDGFILPCPFSATVVHLGALIDVPPDIDRERLEAVRQEAETKLRDLGEGTRREFSSIWKQARPFRALAPWSSSLSSRAVGAPPPAAGG